MTLCWRIDDTGSDNDSDSSLEDEPGCLDIFEEIVEQSDLEKFSNILKKAQQVVVVVERAKRAPYTGHLRATKYHCKKFHANFRSKGFLLLDEFMEWAKAKRQLSRSICNGSKESSSGSYNCAGYRQDHINVHTLDPKAPIPSSVASSHTLIYMLWEEEEKEFSDVRCVSASFIQLNVLLTFGSC